MTESIHTEVFRGIAAETEECQVKLVLFGGFALPVYGVERSTLDIDFLLCDEDVDAFAAILKRRGYAEILRTPQYAKFRHCAPEVLDIDTVFVDRGTMERIWEGGSDEALFGVSLRCASLDILLGTKLHAIRYNEENRRRRDFDDVVELLDANGLEPRGERFVRLCERYGTPEIMERLCEAMARRKAN